MYLFGVTPDVASGQTTPSVVLNMQIASGSGGLYFQAISAWQNGFAIQYTNGDFQYVGYDGSTKGVVAIPNVGITSTFAAGMGGQVFVPIKASTAVASLCPPQTNLVIDSNIVAFGPNGGLWSYPLPACTAVHTLLPTPDGGVVALVSSTNALTSARDLLSLQSNGTPRWPNMVALPYTDVNGATLWEPNLYVTDDGDIAVAQQYVQTDNNRGVLIFLDSGNTGQQIASYSFAPSPTSGGYLLNNPEDFAIAKNTMFVGLIPCNYSSSGGVPGCGGMTTYAVNMPGTSLDYLRGVILSGSTATLNYVALGDSFSSGEGNPPFIGSSSSDGCHRSMTAYPELLAQDYSLHLNLTFVTCSGATSQDMVKPYKHEPSQLAALSSSTQLVTVTAGGDDIGFADFVIQCLFADCSKPSIAKMYLDRANNLEPTLSNFYSAILNAAPNAQVYVLGYPDILPTNGSCVYTSGQKELEWIINITKLLAAGKTSIVRSFFKHFNVSDTMINKIVANNGQVQLTKAEAQVAHQLVMALDNSMKSAIGSVYVRLHYVDPSSQFANHQLCSAGEDFNGVDITNPVYSFHPNLAGEDAYRSSVMPYLDQP